MATREDVEAVLSEVTYLMDDLTKNKNLDEAQRNFLKNNLNDIKESALASTANTTIANEELLHLHIRLEDYKDDLRLAENKAAGKASPTSAIYGSVNVRPPSGNYENTDSILEEIRKKREAKPADHYISTTDALDIHQKQTKSTNQYMSTSDVLNAHQQRNQYDQPTDPFKTSTDKYGALPQKPLHELLPILNNDFSKLGSIEKQNFVTVLTNLAEVYMQNEQANPGSGKRVLKLIQQVLDKQPREAKQELLNFVTIAMQQQSKNYDAGTKLNSGFFSRIKNKITPLDKRIDKVANELEQKGHTNKKTTPK